MSGITGKGASRFDISNVPVSIDWVHHQIHLGNLFSFSNISAVSANHVLEFLVSTGASMPHLRPILQSDDACRLDLYEGTTTSNDGTPGTIYNRNRNSARTLTATVFVTPTLTADGTLIHSEQLQTAKGSYGGKDEWDREFILKPNTKYLLRFTAGNAAISLNVILDMYDNIYT